MFKKYQKYSLLKIKWHHCKSKIFSLNEERILFNENTFSLPFCHREKVKKVTTVLRKTAQSNVKQRTCLFRFLTRNRSNLENQSPHTHTPLPVIYINQLSTTIQFKTLNIKMHENGEADKAK